MVLGRGAGGEGLQGRSRILLPSKAIAMGAIGWRQECWETLFPNPAGVLHSEETSELRPLSPEKGTAFGNSGAGISHHKKSQSPKAPAFSSLFDNPAKLTRTFSPASPSHPVAPASLGRPKAQGDNPAQTTSSFS